MAPIYLSLLAACVFAAGCRAGGETLVPAPGCELVPDGYGRAGGQRLRVDTVVSGLEVPWALALLPGGDLLVTERPGRIRLVRAGRLLEQPVATIEPAATGEGGLLGLALHPDFGSRSRAFYVYYTRRSAGGVVNQVERWQLAPDALSAERERVIIGGIPAAQFHDGGRIRFGPDRMLYVGTGDAREPRLAQDPASLAGKILRLTPEGEVPPDNPFPGRAAFILGVRNTEGFAWADEGTLYVTDHGPSGELGRTGHDEVSVATAGTNLGWPTIYGCQSRPGMSSPLLSWVDAVPPGGAVIYTGNAIPGWDGSLLVATLASEHLHRVVIDSRTRQLVRHETYLRGEYGRLREVFLAPDGALYVTTSNCDGRGQCPPRGDVILRITADRTPHARP
jgi:glucose/arabinose dehydrogenase